MVGRDGRAHHHRTGSGRALRRLVLEDLRPRGHHIRAASKVRVGSRHRKAPSAGNQGQGAHSRSADPDEVEGARIGLEKQVHEA